MRFSRMEGRAILDSKERHSDGFWLIACSGYSGLSMDELSLVLKGEREVSKKQARGIYRFVDTYEAPSNLLVA